MLLHDVALKNDNGHGENDTEYPSGVADDALHYPQGIAIAIAIAHAIAIGKGLLGERNVGSPKEESPGDEGGASPAVVDNVLEEGQGGGWRSRFVGQPGGPRHQNGDRREDVAQLVKSPEEEVTKNEAEAKVVADRHRWDVIGHFYPNRGCPGRFSVSARFKLCCRYGRCHALSVPYRGVLR